MNEQAAAAGQIRVLTSDDIPAVAALFQRTFRNARQAAPGSLESYLRTLFLEHPWQEPQVTSRVYVAADGKIGGFIGVFPARMTLNGKPLRAAVAGTLMVENAQRNPLAGARLLRSFLEGPQDFSFSETANPQSQRMWERLGGKAVAAYSMEWLRVFKPCGFAVSLAGESFSPAKLLRPLAALADWLGERFTGNPLKLPGAPARGIREVEASDDELLAAIPRFMGGYALHPDWDEAALRWILQHTATKERHGALYRRLVYGKDGRLIGCYLYYARPRGIAWVLQMLASSDSVDAVVESLLRHAYRQGSVAVRGRTQPELIDSLLRHKCVFLHRSSTVVHSHQSDVVAAVRSGDALLVGLAGEAWTQLIGGNFV